MESLGLWQEWITKNYTENIAKVIFIKQKFVKFNPWDINTE